MAAQTQISSTTQNFLEIYDITGDIAIMKDGSTSLILSVNAINFGLLAEEEQDAIIYSYAGLLNSLNYSIQILITSVTKDVSNYLHQLEEKEIETTDRIRQAQIHQYREFVATLIQERNVLDKKFYVVIPANALEMGLLPPSTVIPGSKGPDVSTIERSVILEKARNILEPKRDHLIGQFARIGLYARQLQTQEIIQLFYTSYNPEAAEGQQITDSKDYTTPIVNARIQGVTMTDMNNPLVQNNNPAAPQDSPPVVAPAAVPPEQPVQPAPPASPPPLASDEPLPTRPMNTPAATTPPITTPTVPAPAAPPTPEPTAPAAATQPPAPVSMPVAEEPKKKEPLIKVPPLPTMDQPLQSSEVEEKPEPAAAPMPMPTSPAPTTLTTDASKLDASEVTAPPAEQMMPNIPDSKPEEGAAPENITPPPASLAADVAPGQPRVAEKVDPNKPADITPPMEDLEDMPDAPAAQSAGSAANDALTPGQSDEPIVAANEKLPPLPEI